MSRKILSDSSTVKRNRMIIVVIATVLIIASLSLVIYKTIYDNKKNLYSPPEFEVNAVSGTPTPEEKFSYGVFKTKYGFSVGVCAMPQYENGQVHVNFTNPESNEVWLMLIILNEDGTVELGKSGIIKPGEYVECVNVQQAELNNPYSFSVLAFTPDTYTSEGRLDMGGFKFQ